MPRYFMHLAYRGSAFHGWQIQPNAISVQAVIEDALTRYAGQPTSIVGAGRTDAGVNAHMMIAHVDLELDNQRLQRLVPALNCMVGRNIVIYSIKPVADDAHARFDATSRTYRYYCHSGKSPFLSDFSWQAPASLDFEAMNLAAQTLLGRHDFTSFAKLHTDTVTNICTVTDARWVDIGEGRHYFTITADRFLRNMVRAVVGTLVDVGRGKLRPEQIADIMQLQDRCAAGTSMPPHPLFLWDITY